MRKLLIFLILSFAVSASAADWKVCFDRAGEIYNIDKRILLSIAKVESRKNPYTINIGGKGKYYKSKQEALNELQYLNIADSFDLGVMQVNTFWFRRHKVPLEMGYNPCFNIHFGAYVLAYELHRANGDMNVAIGRYHSPTPEKQQKYREKVATAYETLNF